MESIDEKLNGSFKIYQFSVFFFAYLRDRPPLPRGRKKERKERASFRKNLISLRVLKTNSNHSISILMSTQKRIGVIKQKKKRKKGLTSHAEKVGPLNQSKKTQ